MIRPPIRKKGGIQKALLAGSQTPVKHPGLGALTPGPTHPVPVPPINTGPTHPVPTPVNPAPPALNPYTNKPLAANEYVGLPGSEAEHPGMVRIPPPGWWDPNNANYERRNYTIGPHGEIIANEAGYSGDPAHPFDTGREGERNTEFGDRGGYTRVQMSEPGITPWGPSDKHPELPSYPQGSQQRSMAAALLAPVAPSMPEQPQHPFQPNLPQPISKAIASLAPQRTPVRGAKGGKGKGRRYLPPKNPHLPADWKRHRQQYER